MMLFKNDIAHARDALQLSVGQDAGVEADVHAMHEIFFKESTEAVLLMDAENAFTSINRKVMLDNIKFTCPLISTYISSCYVPPTKLFSFGRDEILSKEGTTKVIRLQWGLIPLALHECFTYCLILF